ncbi:MAG: hypothetical protein HOV87_22495 [Catenulispora sp.]|nr:hypothetical protein [Catenulispora sp.]
MYEFSFEFADSDEASASALTSLYRWLREDETVTGEVKIALGEETRPEAMGAVEVVTALLTQLTATGSLAVSFLTWRDSRPAAPRVRIRNGKASIDGNDAEITPERLAAALRALAEADVRETGYGDVEG